MPPSISRGSLSSLLRSKPCAPIPPHSRSFTTSPSLLSIGPESPKFIEIPKTRQPGPKAPIHIKGTLPLPRNLFKGPKSIKKITPNYLAAATPEPTASRHLSPPQNDYIAWKRAIADSRRRNLREGLVLLHRRKVRAERTVAARSADKQAERQARVEAPKREDERLTEPTITQAMKRVKLNGVVPDPNREQRIAEMRARTQAVQAEREERMKAALHNLYMQARNFITTEEQLEQVIETQFVEKPFEKVKPGAKNVWEAYNPPPTVQDMLRDVTGSSDKAVQLHKSAATLTSERVMRLAEELTGGKIE